MKIRMRTAVSALLLLLAGGSSAVQPQRVLAAEELKRAEETLPETEVTLFAAKSLNRVMEELIELYRQGQPNVSVIGNYDSSGTLMRQIQEGAVCDLFFSAAERQMDQLEEEGFVIPGTRQNIVNNQVCVVTYVGSGTAVTGLDDLAKADSLALAGASVPVGMYTRQAMIGAKLLDTSKEAWEITTEEISEALGGIEINECASVGAVTSAVSEQANEVGTVYYSDICGLEDRLEILERIPNELTGDVIYPAALLQNEEAGENERAASEDFLAFLLSPEARQIFQRYRFETTVQPSAK